MNINEISKVLEEQTFWIGENADIEVVVKLYEHNDIKKLSALLNNEKVIETVVYNGSNNGIDILAAMESLIDDNEDYILELSSTK